MSYESSLSELAAEHPEDLEKNAFYEGLSPIDSDSLRKLTEGYPELEFEVEDTLQYFVRYVRDVGNYQRLINRGDMEEVGEADVARGRLHDAMIDSVRILVRNMQAKGKDVSWAANLDKKEEWGMLFLLFQPSSLIGINKRGSHERSF